MAYVRGEEPVPGYRLIKLLGKGGFGEVWKASGPGDSEVALKIITLSLRDGLKEYRAIKLVRKIRHPNLVPTLSFWFRDEEGNVFNDETAHDSAYWFGKGAELIVAMGLGEKNLFDRLKECQKDGLDGIPIDELLGYLEGAAGAIDHLNQPVHDLGAGPIAIQHCDIKPQNILIAGGTAQLCDFGLARVLGDARISMAAGSAAYMAPEMVMENKPSPSSDQYSLAVSYYELRTGVLPFEFKTVAAAYLAHAGGKLDFSRVSDAEQQVLKRATALRPEARYPSAGDLVRSLRQAVGSGAPAAEPVVPGPGSELVPGYHLVTRLDRGGEVWLASAPDGSQVALQVIQNVASVLGQLEFEALELIKGINHAHLAKLIDYWLVDQHGALLPDGVRIHPYAPAADRLILAGEPADKTLLDRLRECRAAGEAGIPAAELLGYLRQAASAVDYLNLPCHAIGSRLVSIQHCDLKPESLLLVGDAMKIGAFGLAQVLDGATAVLHGDGTGLTLAFAAPEMFANQVTGWSDQYALALTYFKLRTGTMPFQTAGVPFHKYIEIHLQGKLDLGALAPRERAVITQATAVQPQKRFATCLALVEALEQACDLPRVPASDGCWDVPAAEAGSAAGAGLPPESAGWLNLSSATTHRGVLAPADSPGQPGAEGVPAEPGAQPEAVAQPELDADSLAFHQCVTLRPGEARANPFGPSSDRQEFLDEYESPDNKGQTSAAKPSTVRRWLVGGAVLAAGLLLAGYGVRELSPPHSPSPPTSALREAVDNLLQHDEWIAAWLLVQEAGGPLAEKESLQGGILRHWRDKARADLAAHQLDRAEAEARAVLERSNEDREARDILRQCLEQKTPEQLKGLLADKQFIQAAETLQEPLLSTAVRHQGREKLRRAWLGHAEDLSKREPGDAETAVQDLLRYFPGDAEAATILASARQRKLTALVQRYVKEKKFAEALDALKQGGDKPETWQPALKDEVRLAWLDLAASEFRAGRRQSAVALCDAILSHFKDDTAATALRAQALPPERKGIATALEGAEKQLNEGPAEQALGQFEQVRKMKGVEGYSDLWKRALLGQARASARLPSPPWTAIKQLLRDLDGRGPAEPGLKVKDLAHAAALRVLVASALPEEGASDPRTLLDHLIKLRQPLNLLASLDRWESESVKAVGQRVITDLLAGLERRPPGEVLEGADRILQYDPHDFATLLVKAEAQSRSGDFKGSRATLEAAELASGDDSRKKDEVAALAALTTTQDPGSKPADLDQAKGILVRLLRTGTPPRPKDLCEALLGLTEKKSAYREDVVKTLDAIVPRLPAGGAKDGLAKRVNALRLSAGSLLVKNLETQLRTAKEPDWEHLLAYCEKAKFTGLGLAGLAECLVERHYPPLRTELQQARVAAYDVKAEREAGAYAHYIRGRVESLSGKPEQAAREVLRAVATDPSWLQGFRRERAVSILEKAGDGLRNPNRPTNPFTTPQRADLAYECLKAASQLLVEAKERVPVSLQINLALAAGYKSNPDGERARELAARLVKTPDRAMIGEAAKLMGESAYPLWLVYARSQEDTPEGRKTAFDSYEEAIRLGQVHLDEDKAADFSRNVLGPAIQLGDKILAEDPDLDLEKRLDRLYALRSRLLRRKP